MVNLQNFYETTQVRINAYSDFSANRINRLVSQVITQLLDEEQFKSEGRINFMSRQQAIEYWDEMNSELGTSVDFRRYNTDGNCQYFISGDYTLVFYITIIIDDLESKSDDYIKGLIAHEISEMSYAWISVQNEKENLKKLKPKARSVRVNQILQQNAAIGTKEHQEHENNVDKEAKRLGFGREIDALNSSKMLKNYYSSS